MGEGEGEVEAAPPCFSASCGGWVTVLFTRIEITREGCAKLVDDPSI